MGFFRRGSSNPVPEPEVDLTAPGSIYQGPVCFANGAHYPVVVHDDGSESIDFAHRLIWVDSNPDSPDKTPDARYVYAKDTDPSHFHLYHKRELELTVTP